MNLSKFKCLVGFLLATTLFSCKKDESKSRTNAGLNDLYIYNVAAKTNTRITNSPDKLEDSYLFSPDNQKIFFNAGDSALAINIDGTGITWLTARLSDRDYSPDGKSIVYSSNAVLFLENTNGTNKHQLTTNAIGFWKPIWSKDGQKIACSSDKGLCIVTLDGAVTNFTSENSAEWYNWSSDSKKLVYSKFISDYAQIFKYDLSKSEESKLSDSWKFNYNPLFCEVTDEIMYLSSVNGDGCDLILMNADGSHQKTISHRNKIISPCWSPDGKYIAFVNEDSNLAVIDSDGNNYHIINDLPGACLDPVWSSDGKYILYNRAIILALN